MKYKIYKTTGIVSGPATDSEVADDTFDIVDSVEELAYPEVHIFKNGVFHPDFGLYSEVSRAKREAHVTNLQAAYNVKLEEPVMVLNLKFSAVDDTFNKVSAEIDAITTTGNFSASWAGIVDLNGVTQFMDEGRSPDSVLPELQDVKKAILNTRAEINRRLELKILEVGTIDVLQALDQFDSSTL